MNAYAPARDAAREYVQLACWLSFDRERVLGLAVNMSDKGLCVRLPHGRGEALREPGVRVQLEVAPVSPSSACLRLEARVAWTEEGGAGERVLGLELGDASSEPSSEVAGTWAALRRRVQQRVLVVDPDPEAPLLYSCLSGPFQVHLTADPELAFEYLRQEAEDVSVIICVEQLPGMHCLAFFDRAAATHPELRGVRIVVSEFTVVGQVQALINQGQLFGYIRKPLSAVDLSQVVERAATAHGLAIENELLNEELERTNARLESENAHLRRRFVGVDGFEQLIGSSEALRRTLSEAGRLRNTDTSVHLWGETGTGKELLARALHAGSLRARGPFVVQNCAGMTESLLQSLLFGHKRGAFTGAHRDHEGVFQQAHGGTLFLDEVAELSPAVQAALLRALQEGEIHALGSPAPVEVDVRILSASQKDLRAETLAGRFREDLYFRLVVMRIRVPPLRERTGDVPVLAAHFLDSFCEASGARIQGFTAEAMRTLEAYAWPGNLRELMNEIQRLVAVHPESRRIHPEQLSEHLRVAVRGGDHASPTHGIRLSRALPYDEALEQLTRALVSRALEASGGNVSHAARALGMDRSRLAKLRDRLGLAKRSSG